MDVVVAVLLGLEEARTAGEDDVGAVDQLLLEVEQLGRRELELRQLVHRVEHRDVGVEVPREGQHHWRVIPGDQRTADRSDVGVEQPHKRGLAGVIGHALRKVRDDDPDVLGIARLADLQIGRFVAARCRPALPNK